MIRNVTATAPMKIATQPNAWSMRVANLLAARLVMKAALAAAKLLERTVGPLWGSVTAIVRWPSITRCTNHCGGRVGK